MATAWEYFLGSVAISFKPQPQHSLNNLNSLTPNPSPNSLTPNPSPNSLTPNPSPRGEGRDYRQAYIRHYRQAC